MYSDLCDYRNANVRKQYVCVLCGCVTRITIHKDLLMFLHTAALSEFRQHTLSL